MSVVVQGIATELMAVIKRIGELDAEQAKPFFDAVVAVDISDEVMQHGIARVVGLFDVQAYEVADDGE